jgi:hypothetical protein
MQKRRRFKQTETLDERLAKEAERLRAQIQAMPPGLQRDYLLRKARQGNRFAYERVAHVSWLAVTKMKKSPLIVHAAQVLRRVHNLPVGPARSDLLQLAYGLLRLHQAGARANVEVIKAKPRPTLH